MHALYATVLCLVFFFLDCPSRAHPRSRSRASVGVRALPCSPPPSAAPGELSSLRARLASFGSTSTLFRTCPTPSTALSPSARLQCIVKNNPRLYTLGLKVGRYRHRLRTARSGTGVHTRTPSRTTHAVTWRVSPSLISTGSTWSDDPETGGSTLLLYDITRCGRGAGASAGARRTYGAAQGRVLAGGGGGHAQPGNPELG
eukprot:6197219-Pleurochrysis_carterae.AAC.2